MFVNDPIGDALTRIRNAQLRKYRTVSIPHTKIIKGILEILKSENYINDFTEEGEGVRKELTVELKYEDGKPIINEIKRVSKPGLRNYKGYREIPKVYNGLGIAILTTPKGIMSGESAKQNKVGGEILCTVF